MSEGVPGAEGMESGKAGVTAPSRVEPRELSRPYVLIGRRDGIFCDFVALSDGDAVEPSI
jgi:hypothetical protein